jgi:hypothetical protein
MTDALDWSTFDPEEPEAVVDRLSNARSIGLLVSGSLTWGRGAALSLAREFARRGRSVVLVDANCERPSLHEPLGLAQGEGYSDHVLFGASLQHVARPVEERLKLVTAGTPVADARRLLGSEHGPTLVESLVAEGALPIFLLRAGAPGVEGLLEALQTLVQLGRSGDDSAVPGGLGSRVSLRLRAPSKRVRRRRPGKRRGWRLLGWLVATLVAVAVGLGLAVWSGDLAIGDVDQERLRSWVDGLRRPEVAVEPQVAPPPIVTSAVQPFNLLLGEYDDAEQAFEQLRNFEQRVPQMTFALAPVEVDGAERVRLMVGPMADSLAVEALRTLLFVRLEPGAAASDWRVQRAPFSIPVDDLDLLSEALRVRDELRAAGLPAHVLRLELSDGSERFRVYSGAFADRAEAEGLLRRFAELRVAHGPLIRRIGLPAGDAFAPNADSGAR